MTNSTNTDVSPNLIWVDLEMTGLDPETCTIVEIATVVTDNHLNVIAVGPQLIIHQPEAVLSKMDSFVVEMHTRSGLLSRIRESAISITEAEFQTLTFLQQHCAERTTPLCGNSVWKDRQFLDRYMPRIGKFLHYRTIDVSTMKEIVRRWYPSSMHCPKKKDVHRALDDILESIEELKWYRDRVLVKWEGQEVFANSDEKHKS